MHPADASGYATGVFTTQQGYVKVTTGQRVFAKIPAGTYHGPLTRMSFIWKGREYNRSLTRHLTVRGLRTVVGRFAREISGETR